MRSLPICLIASGLALTLAACGEEAATKKEKAEVASGRMEVTLRLAHATEAAGDYPGAEHLYLQAVGQASDQPGPQAEIAEFYKRHHEDRKAIESLEVALRLLPGNAELERELANTYISLGEPEKALGILDAAVATNPRDALLYNSRGVALDQIGSYTQAQKSYATAVDLDPAGAPMYKVNTSMSYILSGSYNKAIALLRPMLDVPDAPPIVRQNLALAYGLKGESETALKLGLQDLSESEAAENLKFYRMLAQRHERLEKKTGNNTPSSVPASVVKELFPESEPPVAQETPAAPPAASAAVSPAPVPAPAQTAVAPQPVIVHMEQSGPPPAIIAPQPQLPAPAAVPVTSAAPVAPAPESLPMAVPTPASEAVPMPQLKPKAEASITSFKPAEPEEEPEVVPSPVVLKQTITKPQASVKPVAPDEESDEEIPPPVVKPQAASGAHQPLATMEPSSGNPDSSATPATTGFALPAPVLKPDSF